MQIFEVEVCCFSGGDFNDVQNICEVIIRMISEDISVKHKEEGWGLIKYVYSERHDGKYCLGIKGT